MSLREEVKNINKSEIENIFRKLNVNKVSLDKKKKHFFTIDYFEVFFRLYIDENIQVYIRTNTINSKEKVSYEFVNFNEIQNDNLDLEEYRKNVILFYNNIIKEVLNTKYCPENHKEMIPRNATQEEINRGAYTIYEQRLLTELSYEKMNEFNEWINKVSDKEYIEDQS